MHRVLWLCIAALLVLISQTVGQEPGSLQFKKYTSEKGKYSIKFPGTVVSQQQEGNSAVGKIKINLDIVAVSNKVVFMVAYNDFPEILRAGDVNTMLDGAVTGNAGKDGLVESSEKITHGPDKLPGRKALIKKPGDMYARNLIIIKDLRLYQVMVIGSKSFVTDKVIDDFYASLVLTK
jgi:hypothetical protein